MKSVFVVYSPLCEHNGAFLHQLEEWLDRKGIELCEIPFERITDQEKEWYKSAGLLEKGRFKKSVFIDVFFEGRLIDSVPLKKENIEKGLHIDIQDKDKFIKAPGTEVSVTEFRNLICKGDITWLPIKKDNFKDEMKLCTENYPYGNPPKQVHNRCITLKEEVFKKVFATERIAGVFAQWDRKVVGLIEVFPREIIRKYGFLAGTCRRDEEYLTVGCLEVGYGIPRKEMIDELFFQLEKNYADLGRHLLEGVGTFEWNTGFTPYWVYDKYGFHLSEKINERTVIMEKMIHENL